MILIWVPVCIALTILVTRYVVNALLRWQRSYSLSWPKTLSSGKQAAICKQFLIRQGITAKYPVLLTVKYQLEIWQGGSRLLLSFGSPSSPHTRALFQDLSEFQRRKFPRGNCAVILFYHEVTDTKAFDWSREFHIPILHPAQIRAVSQLLQSGTEDFLEPLFEISAAVTAVKDRVLPEELTLFNGVKTP